MRISKSIFIEKLANKCVLFNKRYLTAKIQDDSITLYDSDGVGLYTHILRDHPEHDYKQEYYSSDGIFTINCYYKNKLTRVVSFYR